MKLAYKERKIEGDFIAKNSFSMGIETDSPLFFELLRNKIYQNPYRAMVQEVMSNCVDANAEAGNKNKPVEVWLPGDMLIFRDAGLGISPQRMQNVYAWYGRSTKREERANEYIGAFGLGAKTPLVASDSYFVETINSGKKFLYNVYIGKNGKGDIDLVSEEATDQPSGTSIKIPISPEHRSSIRNYVNDITFFWPVPPKIYGDLPRQPVKPLMSGKYWAIYDKNDVRTDKNILIEGIPYKYYNYNIPSGLILKVPIGKLVFNASREELQRDKRNDKVVKAILRIYEKEIKREAQLRIENAKHFGEVVDIVTNVPGYQHSWNWVLRWQDNDVVYPTAERFYSFAKNTYGRTKLAQNKVDRINGKTPENAYLLLDKDKVNSYDKQRIYQYLNDNGLARVYVMKAADQLPVSTVPLTSIKVRRNKAVPGSKGAGRPPKTQLRCRSSKNYRLSLYDIDNNNEMVYTDKSLNNYLYAGLDVNVIEVSSKDLKYIEDEPNWVKVEDYINDLFDTYGVSEADYEEILEVNKKYEKAHKWSFLTGMVPELEVLSRKQEIDNAFPANRQMFAITLARYGKIKGAPDNVEDFDEILFTKYPLLKHLNYWAINSHPEDVKKYVDTINELERLKTSHE